MLSVFCNAGPVWTALGPDLLFIRRSPVLFKSPITPGASLANKRVLALAIKCGSYPVAHGLIAWRHLDKPGILSPLTFLLQPPLWKSVTSSYNLRVLPSSVLNTACCHTSHLWQSDKPFWQVEKLGIMMQLVLYGATFDEGRIGASE